VKKHKQIRSMRIGRLSPDTNIYGITILTKKLANPINEVIFFQLEHNLKHVLGGYNGY
jgi:hypothetical protein